MSAADGDAPAPDRGGGSIAAARHTAQASEAHDPPAMTFADGDPEQIKEWRPPVHGPRRLHVSADNLVWVPGWASGDIASFDEAKIIENASAFIEAVRKARPSGAKGTYIRKITLSSTMGVGVAVEDVA